MEKKKMAEKVRLYLSRSRLEYLDIHHFDTEGVWRMMSGKYARGSESKERYQIGFVSGKFVDAIAHLVTKEYEYYGDKVRDGDIRNSDNGRIHLVDVRDLEDGGLAEEVRKLRLSKKGKVGGGG